MYKSFFGLKENPFNVTPDPRYLYSTPHTQEAVACLTYCVQARKGFVLLTGDVGTGKTTLLNKLLEWLRQEQVASAFVFNPRLNPFQFLDYAMSDFGINCQSRLKSAILADLNNWLLERHKAGTTAVLIVDEAQDASPELLEEIRLLTNLETPSGKLLQIVLAGQQELEMKLRLPEFRQLRQRITLRSKTFPLTIEETHEYIATRLRIAGSDGREIFSSDAIDAVHRYSEGIPRVINILCEDSLVSAFADHRSVVPGEIVEGMARELELDIYPPTAPPPTEQRLDDLIKPGINTGRGGRSAPAPSRTLPPSPPPPLPAPRGWATDPEAISKTQLPPQVEAKAAVQTPPARSPIEWGPPENPGDLGWAEEPAEAAPAPSAFTPTATRSRTVPERFTPDDEILQTLRNKESAPKSSPPPPGPAVKPVAPLARTMTTSPPFRVGAPPKPSQSRIIWLGLLAAVVAGAAGVIFIWKYTGQPGPTEVTPASEVRAPVEPPTVEVAPATSSNGETPSALNPPPENPTESRTPTPPQTAPQPAAKAELTPAQPAVGTEATSGRPEPAARPAPPAASRTRSQTVSKQEEAAPPQPPQRFGRAVVTSNVEGARITVDGKTTGEWVTPYEFGNLSVGAHTIVVSKSGYEDVATRVTVREGQTSNFHATLTTGGGEITITTNPAGLPVSINGGPFHPSPLHTSLTAGPHTYRIQLPNSRIYEGAVEMRTGAVITRRVDFSAGEWLTPAQ